MTSSVSKVAKLSLNEARFTKDQFAQVTNSVKEGIVVQGTDAAVTWANEQSTRILGLTLDQLTGHTSMDEHWRCVHEDGTDFPGQEHPAMVALATGKPQHDVVMGVHKPGGGLSWILVSSNPLADGGGVVTSFVDITERVARERQLAATHARESAILNGANVAIIGADTTGIIHTFNAAAERMLGWTAQEMIGKQTPAIIHLDAEVASRAQELGIEPGFEVFVHVARARGVEKREWTYVRKDGSRFKVELTVTRMEDATGELVGFMGISEDITEKQAVLADLNKLALVASRTHNVVILTDAEARAEWVNDAFTRLTGYTVEEVRGKKIGRLVQGPDTDPETVAKMRAAIQAGEGFQVEVLNYAKDGFSYWLDIDCRPYRDADGEVLGYVAVETDITSRKAMESALREERRRLQAVVESLPDNVFILDRTGRFQDAHCPAPELWTLRPEDLPGRHLTAILPARVAERMLSHIESAATARRVETIEYELRLPSGAKDFEARIVPSGADEVMVIVRDVSERKLLDRLKDEFISTVSHELRTPLTAIRGTLGLLGGGVIGELSPEAAQLIQAAQSNSERLSRLIDDILDLEKSMRGGLRLHSTDCLLAPLLERAVREAQPYADEFSVRYELSSLDGAARAHVDPDRLLQVLHNLLSNAAKYGSPNATVHVRLVRGADSTRIEVQNEGVPIPDEFRPRMFRRFAMLDGSNRRARRGTGLGLAMSRALVEQMGGEIDYSSTQQSTVFWITLPN